MQSQEEKKTCAFASTGITCTYSQTVSKRLTLSHLITCKCSMYFVTWVKCEALNFMESGQMKYTWFVYILLNDSLFKYKNLWFYMFSVYSKLLLHI